MVFVPNNFLYLNENYHFNPFLSQNDNDDYHFYDEDIDTYCDTLAAASSILENCKVVSQSTFNSNFASIDNYISLYFHNIDGFKANFDMFLNDNVNLSRNFDLYCFVETNLHEGVPHDFNIDSSYIHEQLYAIDGKQKGSGISLFYNNNIKFTRLSKLCFRNAYFECLGGYIETDNIKYYVVVVYRFNNPIGKKSHVSQSDRDDKKEKEMFESDKNSKENELKTRFQ